MSQVESGERVAGARLRSSAECADGVSTGRSPSRRVDSSLIDSSIRRPEPSIADVDDIDPSEYSNVDRLRKVFVMSRPLTAVVLLGLLLGFVSLYAGGIVLAVNLRHLLHPEYRRFTNSQHRHGNVTMNSTVASSASPIRVFPPCASKCA